jgi:hypothetical protein
MTQGCWKVQGLKLLSFFVISFHNCVIHLWRSSLTKAEECFFEIFRLEPLRRYMNNPYGSTIHSQDLLTKLSVPDSFMELTQPHLTWRFFPDIQLFIHLIHSIYPERKILLFSNSVSIFLYKYTKNKLVGSLKEGIAI